MTVGRSGDWPSSEGPFDAPPPVDGGVGHVVVAEDDPMVRAYSASILTNLGYRVTAVRDGRAALEIIGDAEVVVDLLVTDVVMPDGMNGRELAVRAAAAQPNLKVLFVSGFAAQISASAFDNFPHFLAKPYRRSDFEAAVIAAIAPTVVQSRGSFGGALVYLIDSDSLRRRAIATMLSEFGFTPYPYRNSKNLLDDVATLRPGCVLLDARISDASGLALIPALGEHRARLPIVAMTDSTDVATAVRAMKSGARDVLERPFGEDALLDALNPIFLALGHQVQTSDRAIQARRELAKLTKRQSAILQGLVSGLSNKRLAYELNLSVRTIEVHRARMMGRLGLKALPDAARLVFEAGDQTFK